MSHLSIMNRYVFDHIILNIYIFFVGVYLYLFLIYISIYWLMLVVIIVSYIIVYKTYHENNMKKKFIYGVCNVIICIFFFSFLFVTSLFICSYILFFFFEVPLFVVVFSLFVYEQFFCEELSEDWLWDAVQNKLSCMLLIFWEYSTVDDLAYKVYTHISMVFVCIDHVKLRMRWDLIWKKIGEIISLCVNWWIFFVFFFDGLEFFLRI